MRTARLCCGLAALLAALPAVSVADGTMISRAPE